jgi:acetyl-CoA C-acetyltransferase
VGTPNVWILGGYQSDFARNLAREGHDFADLTAEVVDSTLTAAEVEAPDIEVVHLGNAFGEIMLSARCSPGRDTSAPCPQP